MLIVNADDLGRSRSETDAAIQCYEAGRITSTTAMVFMQDSERAADIVRGLEIAVGLHLNLSERLTASGIGPRLRESHERVFRFLAVSKYAVLLYNPSLRQDFRNVVEAQFEEFERLFGRRPSHVDGHQHLHLCANVLIDRLLPAGHRVRRSFSFSKGEKGVLNRRYREVVDRRLARDYYLADSFFSLEMCLKTDRLRRVFDLASTSTVELMTHPVMVPEYRYLMSDDFLQIVSTLRTGTYAEIGNGQRHY